MHKTQEMQEAVGLDAIFKAAGLKSITKPKNHRFLPEQDIELLHFVASKCTNRRLQPCPANNKEWKPFFHLYAVDARQQNINLPDLRRWNVIRKSRLYDICKDLHAAQKWWSVARL